MPTRLYFTNQDWYLGIVSLSPKGAWDQYSAAQGSRLTGTKAGLTASFSAAETNANTAWDNFFFFAVSDALEAQTISGTLDLCVAALESNADADMVWHLHVWATVGDTNVVRGTLIADFVDTPEFPVAAAGVQLTAPQTITSTAVLAGDRLIIELCYRAKNATTASRTGTIYYGGTSGTDLTHADTDTTHPGWLEFSGDVTFVTETVARVSRLAVEALRTPLLATTTQGRTTRVAAEALVAPTTPTRITRVAAEALVQLRSPTQLPQVLIEVAFVNNPGDTVLTWKDISSSAKRLGIRRGRQDELNQMEAGTLDIGLVNDDARFNPNNTASPYYPNVKPGKRIRIRVTFDGVKVWTLWTGFVESWGMSWPDQYAITETQVSAVDGTKFLATAGVPVISRPVEYGHDRIHAILDYVNWAGPSGTVWTLDSPTLSLLGTTTYLGPYGDRVIGQAASLIQAKTFALTDMVWNHFQQIDQTEQGMLYLDAYGRVVFIGRHELLTLPRYTQTQAVFGDGPGELPYARLVPTYDDHYLWNDVTITRETGVAQNAGDAASQTAYFKRSTNKGGLLMTTDAESLALAQWMVALYKAPQPRIVTLTLEGHGDTDETGHWHQMFSRDLGDRIRVIRRMAWAGVGGTLERTLIIQGIDHTVDRETGRWETTWSLAPAIASAYGVIPGTPDPDPGNPVFPAIWHLERIGQGELGIHTFLGY